MSSRLHDPPADVRRGAAARGRIAGDHSSERRHRAYRRYPRRSGSGAGRRGALTVMSAESLPPPVPALFPERAARERVDGWLTRELLDADARIVCGSVVPTIDMAQFRRELAAFDFETPRSL